MRRLVFGGMFLLLALISSARAEVYVGASYLDTSSEFRTAVANFDADDTSWKGYIGFTLMEYLAVELSYRELGVHSTMDGMNTLSAELESYDASALGVFPVGKRLRLLARVGYANISREGSFSFSGVLSGFNEDSFELIYGAGIEYEFGKRFGLRAEWEEYDVDDELNSLSAGAFYRF